jgi:hypothetical protein
VSEPVKSAPAPAATPRWASTVVIPTTWTPEQALAVFELLDDLRDRLWDLHGSQIQDLLQQEQGSAASNALTADPDDDDPASF